MKKDIEKSELIFNLLTSQLIQYNVIIYVV